MKNFIKITLICLLYTTAVQAQQQDSTQYRPIKDTKRIYVGLGLSNISYMLETGRQMSGSSMGGSLEPLITPHAGYRLSPRINVQVGFGYDKDKNDAGSSYREDGDSEVTYEHRYNTTWGWAFPVTLQFTPFNPSRRLQLYATAKLVPVIGGTELQHTKDRAGVTTVLPEEKVTGINNFFIGGLLLKYRINRRFDTYLEGNLIYKNLNRSSLYEAYRPKSLGLGVDFKF